MTVREIDWDALVGYRGEFRRPVVHDGVRYTHATVRHKDLRSDLWVLELQPAQFVARNPEWWAENRPGAAVPQEQPSVGVVDGLAVLVTEWRPALVLPVDGYALLHRQDVFTELPMREVEDMPTSVAGMQALIEQLVKTGRED